MKKILLVVALAFATPAFAEGTLVRCLSGCPAKAGMLKADAVPTDTWWIGPSLGLSMFARDSATKAWESGLILSFSYGVFYKPTWSPTSSFLSLNLGLAAGSISAFQGTSTFDITIPVTIGIMDIIAVGYGPRFKFATSATTKDSVSGVLFIGLATSFGGSVMLNAIFAAILKELMIRYPGLAWASIWVQIVDVVNGMGPGAREEFDRWWMAEMDIPCPGMEPQENPGPVYDPGKV